MPNGKPAQVKARGETDSSRDKGIRALSILMATKGVTTRLQKEMGMIQSKLTQLQVKFTQLDASIDACLKDFQEGIKTKIHSEVRSELHSLFEQYFGETPPPTVTGLVSNKAKGILRGPPLGFLVKEIQ
ncbi:hypothetical protein J1N35_037613 [Gossypium stocksii]|uniref:Uncharacterized protein n=1 Tax=Gossypium stocksii TaxID=47602 RepID=A0A9D3UMC9_9ROSI|nr:hypothetical protein J1N35_037613 [Gossypium stocksii]